jgi:rhodanese-related sulfurtransferase
MLRASSRGPLFETRRFTCVEREIVMEFIVANWYLFLGLIVVLGLLLYDPISRRMYGIQSVPALQVPLLMSHQAAVVLDVCEPKEFEAGHVPGAVNVPLSKLGEGLGVIEKYKTKPVVVCCRSGNRSVKGAITLKRNGFETVYNLSGGLVSWEKESLPVER